MDTLLSFSHGRYRFGTIRPLTSVQLARLADFFQTPGHAPGQHLEGRRSVSRFCLDGVGAVVIKRYHRGGMLSHLIANTYLKIGKPRSQIEFEQMALARSVGVQTPEPIAFAYRGSPFYCAWLVTREVKQSISMAQLCRTSPERVTEAMRLLCQQVDLLVAHRIRHADFHPGNVLVDERDQIYIIDLDKARPYAGNLTALRSAYQQRWCRAVHKHGLPSMLCELMGTNIH